MGTQSPRWNQLHQLLLLLGCGFVLVLGSCNACQPLPACTSDNDCEANVQCVEGMCQPVACSQDKPCPTDQNCQQGQCVRCTDEAGCGSSSSEKHTEASEDAGSSGEPNTNEQPPEEASQEQPATTCSLSMYVKSETFKGHTERVQDIALFRGGEQLLSASNDSSIRIWDIGSRRVLRTYHGLQKFYRVAIRPKGQFFASAGDFSLQLWNVKDPNPVRTYSGHKGTVFGLAFHPNGEQLFSAAMDHTIRVWEVNTGKLLKTYSYKSNEVCKYTPTFAIDPQGKHLAVGLKDPTTSERIVRLIELSSGKTLRTFKGPTYCAQALLFHPDGKQLLAGTYGGEVFAWNLETTQVLWSRAVHKQTINAISLDTNNRYLITASDDYTAKIIDLEKGYVVHTIKGHTRRMNRALFWGDGTQIYTASDDASIKVWTCDKTRCQGSECKHTGECSGGKVCHNCQCKACQGDADCAFDSICLEGTCQKGECREAFDCKHEKDGMACINRRCTPCQADKDCGSVMICTQNKCVYPACTEEDKPCKDNKACESKRCVSCTQDSQCGKLYLCGGTQGQGTCCRRLETLTGQTTDRCEPPANPCQKQTTQTTCRHDVDCPNTAICWWGLCVEQAEWEKRTAFQCQNARLDLSYGGAWPDRLYQFELKLPLLQDNKGQSIQTDHGLHLAPNRVVRHPQHIPRPVKAVYNTSGLLVTGENSFSLVRIRSQSSMPALGTGWAGTQPLKLEWRARWQFGGDPERFASSLRLIVWSTDETCQTETTYLAHLPGSIVKLELQPQIRKLCKWPAQLAQERQTQQALLKTCQSYLQKGENCRIRSECSTLRTYSTALARAWANPCSFGKVCIQNQCANCTKDSDCPSKNTCYQGICIPPAP